MLKMRILLVVSFAIFVLCSSVNMVPERSFLESIKSIKDVRDKTKRQDEQYCLDLFQFCIDSIGCLVIAGEECFSKTNNQILAYFILLNNPFQSDGFNPILESLKIILS